MKRHRCYLQNGALIPDSSWRWRYSARWAVERHTKSHRKAGMV